MAETLIYLDNAATAPLRPEVLETMLPYLRDHHGNPSSLHRAGKRTRSAVNKAREQVAALIGATPDEIIFTSGGTEANNLAISGTMRNRGGAMITAATEHHAVLHAARHWSQANPPVELPVNPSGLVDLQLLSENLEKQICLVSIMHGNNETGVLQPVGLIGSVCRTKGVPYHVDAVQSAGHVPIDVRGEPIDLLSLSAHKLGGPKGMGALYIRGGVALTPLMTGGGQEGMRRPGTENVAAIVGFGTACEIAQAELDAEADRLAALRQRLEQGIRARVANCWINGEAATRLPHIASVGLAGVEGEGILYSLDAEGICISTGSACTAGTVEPSHVLKAMGQTNETALSAIRISLGHQNTEADIDRLLNVLPRVLHELRQ